MKKIIIATALVCLLGSCCNSSEVVSEAPQSTTISDIMARRSIRVYKDTPVEKEKMDQIAMCGINAANGMNAQNWEVRITSNPEFINGVTALYVEDMKKDERGAQMVTEPGFKNMFRNAPTVAFIATKDGGSLIDCGLMAGNMLIAAQSLGIGSVCLGGPVRFMNGPVAASYIDQLGFSEGYQLVLAIGFGYADEAPEAKPRDAGKIKWIE